MLKVRDLYVYLKNLRILEAISIDVEDSGLATLLGSNGAGKSTLLITLCGIMRPRSGSIELSGKSLGKLAPHRIFELGMVLVPQGRRLFSEMSVLENLKQGAYRSPRVRNIGQKLDEVYAYFPVLLARKGQRAGTLSGGEQQMLAIGRALMANPNMLLLDEPTSGLAPLVMANLADTISALHKGGLAILLVEQNVHTALSLADIGYVLENGRIIASGKTSELSQSELIRRAYLGA
jgi:branched-chain amino acid transport system ATP-binding protein